VKFDALVKALEDAELIEVVVTVTDVELVVVVCGAAELAGLLVARVGGAAELVGGLDGGDADVAGDETTVEVGVEVVDGVRGDALVEEGGLETAAGEVDGPLLALQYLTNVASDDMRRITGAFTAVAL
jgi:hypothetical protein